MFFVEYSNDIRSMIKIYKDKQSAQLKRSDIEIEIEIIPPMYV